MKNVLNEDDKQRILKHRCPRCDAPSGERCRKSHYILPPPGVTNWPRAYLTKRVHRERQRLEFPKAKVQRTFVKRTRKQLHDIILATRCPTCKMVRGHPCVNMAVYALRIAGVAPKKRGGPLIYTNRVHAARANVLATENKSPKYKESIMRKQNHLRNTGKRKR